MSDSSLPSSTSIDLADSLAALPPGASWQEQDAVLRHMWMDNKSPQAIGEALGRSVSAIMTRAARLGLPRRSAPGRKRGGVASSGGNTANRVAPAYSRTTPAADTAAGHDATGGTAPRICLMCLTTFQSVGRHNRICASCKGSAEYSSASTLSDIHLPSS